MILDYNEKNKLIGFKPSEGIGTLDEARSYLVMYRNLVDADLLSPKTFSNEASRLITNIVDEL